MWECIIRQGWNIEGWCKHINPEVDADMYI